MNVLKDNPSLKENIRRRKGDRFWRPEVQSIREWIDNKSITTCVTEIIYDSGIIEVNGELYFMALNSTIGIILQWFPFTRSWTSTDDLILTHVENNHSLIIPSNAAQRIRIKGWKDPNPDFIEIPMDLDLGCKTCKYQNDFLITKVCCKFR